MARAGPVHVGGPFEREHRRQAARLARRDEPLQAAAEALANGDLVAMMPQGTIPRGKAFYDPQLKGRWGAARLAALAKVPVIPVGPWGTEKVWPRSTLMPPIAAATLVTTKA